MLILSELPSFAYPPQIQFKLLSKLLFAYYLLLEVLSNIKM